MYFAGDLVAAFERDGEDELREKLEANVSRLQLKINEKCEGSYEEFVRSMETIKEILPEGLRVDEFRDRIESIRIDVNSSASELLKYGEQVKKLHRIRHNLERAFDLCERCQLIAHLDRKTTEFINQQDFYTALLAVKKLQTLTMGLTATESRFAQFIMESRIPEMRKRIADGVKKMFNDWLAAVRSDGHKIGKVAMDTCRVLQSSDTSLLRDYPTDLKVAVVEEVQNLRNDKLSILYCGADKAFSQTVALIDLQSVLECQRIYKKMQEGWGVFRDYYSAQRQKQLHVEMTELARIAANHTVTNPLLGRANELGEDIEKDFGGQPWICHLTTCMRKLIGFFMVEDVVRHGTNPSPVSDLDTCLKWGQCVDAIAHALNIRMNTLLNEKPGTAEMYYTTLPVARAFVSVKSHVNSFVTAMIALRASASHTGTELTAEPISQLFQNFRSTIAGQQFAHAREVVSQILRPENLRQYQTVDSDPIVKKFDLEEFEDVKTTKELKSGKTYFFSTCVVQVINCIVAFATDTYSFVDHLMMTGTPPHASLVLLMEHVTSVYSKLLLSFTKQNIGNISIVYSDASALSHFLEKFEMSSERFFLMYKGDVVLSDGAGLKPKDLRGNLEQLADDSRTRCISFLMSKVEMYCSNSFVPSAWDANSLDSDTSPVVDLQYYLQQCFDDLSCLYLLDRQSWLRMKGQSLSVVLAHLSKIVEAVMEQIILSEKSLIESAQSGKSARPKLPFTVDSFTALRKDILLLEQFARDSTDAKQTQMGPNAVPEVAAEFQKFAERVVQLQQKLSYGQRR